MFSNKFFVLQSIVGFLLLFPSCQSAKLSNASTGTDSLSFAGMYQNDTVLSREYDIVSYHAILDLSEETPILSGELTLVLKSVQNQLEFIELDAKEIEIEEIVSEKEFQKFAYHNKETLKIFLSSPLQRNEIKTFHIQYHVPQPSEGLRRYPEQVYTAFHTDRWLISNDDPNDKATFRLELSVPEEWEVISNGTFIQKEDLENGKTRHHWNLEVPYSSYLFGFVAGRMERYSEKFGEIELEILGSKRIISSSKRFIDATKRMLQFFEEKSGIPYPAKRYTQVFVSGNVAQELANFSLLRESYALEFLENPKEDWLIAHELAHQWWGNLITCRSWGEFWLNEAFAVFMVAAYKEKQWGEKAYQREKALALRRYERLQNDGKDRPLVLPEGTPSKDVGGPISYTKGALILFLLREKLENDLFWKALKRYSQYGSKQTVTTRDLQKFFQEESSYSLEGFFSFWAFSAPPAEYKLSR